MPLPGFDATQLGPLVVALLIGFGVLWREHLRATDLDRSRLDEAIKGWQSQTDATNRVAEATERLAAAWEARNRRDAERRRRDDQ